MCILKEKMFSKNYNRNYIDKENKIILALLSLCRYKILLSNESVFCSKVYKYEMV